MKYLIISLGTRGDMEPFLAIADILVAAGHSVVCAMPEQFNELVAQAGHQFLPLDKRLLELINSPLGTDIMGQKGNLLQRIRQIFNIAKASSGVSKHILQQQQMYIAQAKPDRVICHPKCIYARVWGMKHPGASICASPIPNISHPSKAYSHVGFAKDFGALGNRFSFWLLNQVMATVSKRYMRAFQSDFSGIELRRKSLLRYFLRDERTLYLISPTLVPKPPEWPVSAQVPGYFERVTTAHWSPPSAVTNFLERYASQDITFITFGSMVSDRPQDKVAAILEVLGKHTIPAIINSFAGGLPPQSNTPDHILFVNDIPYDWIFSRVHSVVHHGGSGTTHTSVKHRRPCLVIPHAFDQFFWDQVVARHRLGPRGIGIKHLTAASFEPLILELRTNRRYVENAKLFGEAMQREAQSSMLLEELEGSG